MDDADSLDIELRDPDDIGCRIALLATLVIWPEHASIDERDRWADWLEHQGAIAIASSAEYQLLYDRRTRELNDADLDVCARAFDALLPLCWTIALSDRIGFSLDEPTTREVFEGIPLPPDRIEPFLDQLVLRNEEEIAIQRERAEVWNWRFSAEHARRNVDGIDLVQTEDAIAEVVLECATGFVIDEIDGVDFLVDGVRVSDLSADQLDVQLVASEEQLRALNWVCGLTEWDVIHLPD